MKIIIVPTLYAVLALSLVACGSNKNSAEIPDPFTECKAMEEASHLVGFDVMVPDTIDEMDKSVIRVDMAEKLIEVIYNNDAGKLTVRKAEGNEDVSGDYTKYSNTLENTERSRRLFLHDLSGKGKDIELEYCLTQKSIREIL